MASQTWNSPIVMGRIPQVQQSRSLLRESEEWWWVAPRCWEFLSSRCTHRTWRWRSKSSRSWYVASDMREQVVSSWTFLLDFLECMLGLRTSHQSASFFCWGSHRSELCSALVPFSKSSSLRNEPPFLSDLCFPEQRKCCGRYGGGEMSKSGAT